MFIKNTIVYMYTYNVHECTFDHSLVSSYLKPCFSWEDGRLLLQRENFFSDLEFYKKDNIPQDTFDRLRQFIEDPAFQVLSVCAAFWLK